MTKEIYVVVACVEHEGSDVIKAFADKSKAESFIKICEEYPRCPQEPEIEDPEDVWEHWDKARVSWLENHPGGEESAMAEYFMVNPVTMVGK
jgi:hypothetical protein